MLHEDIVAIGIMSGYTSVCHVSYHGGEVRGTTVCESIMLCVMVHTGSNMDEGPHTISYADGQVHRPV